MPVRLRSDLHNYQHRAVQFIKSTERCALFLDMGLGKSSITLTAISDLQDQMEIHKALVIAPLRVANSVWDHEAKLWKHLRHLKVQVCTGTERERLTALHRDADIYTINRENVPWLVKQYGKKWPFDCVIIDESDSFKSATSQRFKALKKILPFTNYMVLLTGTPSPNGLLDIWSQIYLLDGGTALGRTMTAYKQRFFEADYMGYKYTPRAGADLLIHNAVASKVLSMRAEDYLELPDRLDLTEYVDLPKDIMQTYKEFERELLLELDTGEVVEAISAAVLANKLLQFCISEGTDVLTNNGWKKIETLTNDDLLWDGIEWANYSEIVCNGYKDVIILDGVKMTPEHKVLTVSGWMTAGDILNGDASKRFNRVDVWIPNCFREGWFEQKQKCYMVMPMCLWGKGCTDWKQFAQSTITTGKSLMRMCGWGGDVRRSGTLGDGTSRHERHSSIPNMVWDALSMFEHKRQGFCKLWGEGSNCYRYLGKQFRKFLGRYVKWLSEVFNFGQDRQHEGLFKTKLSLGDSFRAIKQYPCESVDKYPGRSNDSGTSCEVLQNKNGNITCENISVQMGRVSMVRKCKRYFSKQIDLYTKWGNDIAGSVQILQNKYTNTSRQGFSINIRPLGLVQTTNQEKRKVYDIVDCGKRNRFTVRGEAGQLLIVHNCSGAVYTDEHKNWKEIHTVKLDALADLIEQNHGEPIFVAYNFKTDLERLQQRFPKAQVLDRNPNTIVRWNAGEIPLLLAHPASAGHGINAQHGGSIIVWFCLNWSLGLYQQFNARLHRQGQTKPVRIVHIVARDTIDERIISALAAKDVTQSDLLKALKHKEL